MIVGVGRSIDRSVAPAFARFPLFADGDGSGSGSGSPTSEDNRHFRALENFRASRDTSLASVGLYKLNALDP